MAAMRSALGMLSRRTCGSSAAASLGGRGLEIQVFRTAAPRTPPPLPSSLRPPGRNPESLWRFSTAGREQTDKSEGAVRMCWQRCRNRVKNLDVYDWAMLSCVYATVVVVGSALYKMN